MRPMLTVTLADGSELSPAGEAVSAVVEFIGQDGRSIRLVVSFRVVERLHNDCILGVDWLKANNPVIDWVGSIV